MKNMTFPEITLCSIVKNEKNTRGGGIEAFIHSIVPYVGKAVIVDTGSTDGTLEILKKMQKSYKNLDIYQRKFDGFASSRNYSLSKSNYGKVLILDADERINKKNLLTLQEELKETKSLTEFDGFLFNVENIFEDGIRKEHLAPLNPRLFNFEKGVYFENTVNNHSEELRFKGTYFTFHKSLFMTSVIIDHYYTPKDYY